MLVSSVLACFQSLVWSDLFLKKSDQLFPNIVIININFKDNWFFYIQTKRTNCCLVLFANIFKVCNFVLQLILLASKYIGTKHEFLLPKDKYKVLCKNFACTTVVLMNVWQAKIHQFAKICECSHVCLPNVQCYLTWIFIVVAKVSSLMSLL